MFTDKETNEVLMAVKTATSHFNVNHTPMAICVDKDGSIVVKTLSVALRYSHSRILEIIR